jgi:hypothetical protein
MKLVAFLLLLCSAALAEEPCVVKFSVVRMDDLNNVEQGFSPKTLDWFEKKMAKKHPGLCYDPGAAPVVLFFSAKPAVYHGVRTVTTSSTHNDPVNGTVTDTSGQEVGTVSGTVQTTSQSSYGAPYEVDYDRLYLSIEQKQPDGTWKVLHNFSGKTLHPEMFWVCTHNCHPKNKLVEDALDWLQKGGLTDSRQSALP